MNPNNKYDLVISDLDNNEYKIQYTFDENQKLLGYSNKTQSTYKSESDVIDAIFDERTPKSYKLDYSVAAASGVLCSMLDIFWVGQFSLYKAQEIGRQQAEDFVQIVAKNVKDKNGNVYRGKTLEGAIKHLEDLFPMPGDLARNDFGSGLLHHFRDFTHHPTIVGLFFSIFAQFTCIICGTDANGRFLYKKIDPQDDYIGKNIPEKLLFGTVHWVFHLISDMAGSRGFAGEGTGIPGPILAFLKEISTLPIVGEINVKYKDQKDIKFSEFLSKLFNSTFFWDRETNQRVRFDLRTEMGITSLLLKQSVPVVANECIVRGFYFISRLVNEIKENKIESVKDISRIDAENIVPANNKVLIRMLTISTGVFSVMDVAQAAIKANKDSDKFFAEFVSRINFVGIGRFVIAIAEDAKYIFQDIKKMYKSYQNHIYTIHKELYQLPEWNTLSINKDQATILFSIENRMLLNDIWNTHSSKAITLKRQWRSVWYKTIHEELYKNGKSLIETDRELYQAVNMEINNSDTITWLYAVLLEAILFKPYTKLSEDKKDPYKGLKLNDKYLKDVFALSQNEIDQNELIRIKNSYSKYKSILQNNTAKVATGIVGTVAVSVLTGGLALAYAPQIAIALAGSSFAGISGAALTSASLAAIGGGALAAGGLGIAGGTAIIAGGGAAVGLVGGGAITATSALLGTSEDLTLDMLSKVLTITDLVVVGRYKRLDVVRTFAENTDLMIARLDHDIEVMKDNLPYLDKEDAKELKQRINNSKASLTILKRANKEFNKLQNS